MKLAKALREKNRIVGLINEKVAVLRGHNVVKSNESETSKVDTKKTLSEIKDLTVDLVNLKASIAQANVPILYQLHRIVEVKKLITQLQYLPTTETERVIGVGEGQKFVKESPQITMKELTAEVDSFKKELETLQDVIDSHNATTEVD